MLCVLCVLRAECRVQTSEFDFKIQIYLFFTIYMLRSVFCNNDCVVIKCATLLYISSAILRQEHVSAVYEYIRTSFEICDEKKNHFMTLTVIILSPMLSGFRWTMFNTIHVQCAIVHWALTTTTIFED